jgi:hypothetical protein
MSTRPLAGDLAAGEGRSVVEVPRISSFYGITIVMFWNEGHHARPHFHARYGGQVASIAFDGELIAGSSLAGPWRSWASGHSSTRTSSSRTGSAPVATSHCGGSIRFRRMGV